MANPVLTSTNTSDHFLKKEEAAEVLKVSLRKMETLLAEGQVPYIKLGGQIRICLDDLKRLPRSVGREKRKEPSPYVK